MARSQSNRWSLSIALFLNRLFLGGYLLLAGVTKVRGGVAQFYEDAFARMQPGWMPHWLSVGYGYSFPFLEIAVGALLILGLAGRGVAIVFLMMMSTIVIALAGVGQLFATQAGYKQAGPFHTNLILMALLFLLAVTGPGRISLDTLRRRSRRSRAGLPTESML